MSRRWSCEFSLLFVFGGSYWWGGVIDLGSGFRFGFALGVYDGFPIMGLVNMRFEKIGVVGLESYPGRGGLHFAGLMIMTQ